MGKQYKKTQASKTKQEMLDILGIQADLPLEYVKTLYESHGKTMFPKYKKNKLNIVY